MKKKFLFRFLVLLLCIGFFSQITVPSQTAYASSWTKKARDAESNNRKDGIYAGNSNKNTNLTVNDPNFLEEFLSGLLIALGQQLENLLCKAGITLDNVIYGRVNGNGVKLKNNVVSLFTFELTNNNPYGLVGAAIYQIFRMISYGIIALIVIGKISGYSFLSMTPQNLNKVQASFSHLILSFLLLTLTPYLLDVVLYLRDVLLYIVSKQASSLLKMDDISVGLTEILRKESDGRLVGGMVYIASIVYSLYLAFLYAGYSMSFLVCFASFPLVVMMSNVKRDLLKNWVSTVSYFILIPVMDAALLLIPAYMLKMNVAGIIVLFSCMCMTQARGVLAQLLGLQDKTGGMMGFAAMMAAGRLLGSTISAGKSAIGKLKGAKEDKNMAEYEEKMAAATGEATGSSNPVNAQEAGIESRPQQHSQIADVHANVNNFESGPLSSQISHTKKAELYRKRAKQRGREAIGALAGGTVGGLAGASAGLMMGPATTAMGASVGMDAGSQVGAALFANPEKIGRGIGRAAAFLNGSSTTIFGGTSAGDAATDADAANLTSLVTSAAGAVASQETMNSEQVFGSVDISDAPSTVSSGPAVSTNTASSSIGIDSVTQKAVINHVYSNSEVIRKHCEELDNDYNSINDSPMEHIFKEMKSANAFSGLNKDKARDMFRNRVRDKYMNEFKQRYESDSERVISDDALLESAARATINNEISKHRFSKYGDNSFVSESALDDYSWFEL